MNMNLDKAEIDSRKITTNSNKSIPYFGLEPPGD